MAFKQAQYLLMCLFFLLVYHPALDIYILLPLWVLWTELPIFNTALAKRKEMTAKPGMQIVHLHPSRSPLHPHHIHKKGEMGVKGEY